MLRYAPKASCQVLITGGAGFIGTNLAQHLLATTDVHITVYDNLSREGAEANLAWLKQQAAPGRLRFIRGDVRNSVAIADAVCEAHEVYHLAARCPRGGESRADFDGNVTGTLNVLDAARRSAKKPMVLFVSIGDMYGRVKSALVEPGAPGDSHAVFEQSVATADRFMRQYARAHGVKTVVMRPDTISGPRQFGGDHRAWMSNYVRNVLAGRPVRVIGDGRQVRSVLHVSDLVEAMSSARAYLGMTAGKVYNLRGGMSHSISVIEMIRLIERVCCCKAEVEHTPERRVPRAFPVVDNGAFSNDTGWIAKHSLEQTVRDVACFWRAHESVGAESKPGFLQSLTRAA